MSNIDIAIIIMKFNRSYYSNVEINGENKMMFYTFELASSMNTNKSNKIQDLIHQLKLTYC